MHMGGNFPNKHWIFDAGDDFHRTAAYPSGFDVDAEYAFQALSPGHGCPPFGGRHRHTMLAVRCEYAIAQQCDAMRYLSCRSLIVGI